MRRDEARITMFFLYNAKLHHFDFDFGNDTLDVYSNKIFFNLILTFLLSSTYVHVLVKFPELVHVQYKGILVIYIYIFNFIYTCI